MLSLVLPEKIEAGDYCSFSDESDLTAKYLVIGGISCSTSYVARLREELQFFQSQMPYRDRLEWKNTDKKNEVSYKKILDWFCEVNSEQLVDFHALIVDMHKFDHKKHNDGDKEKGFDKMLFQSFYAAYRRYPGLKKLRCFHGNKSCRHPIGNLRGMLNAKINMGKIYDLRFPFVEVKLASVKDTLELQLADLLIGCTGFQWNERKGATADSPKARVSNYFRSECPVVSLAEKSPRSFSHFDIWEFRM